MSPEALKLRKRMETWVAACRGYGEGYTGERLRALGEIAIAHDEAVQAYWMNQAHMVKAAAEETVRIVREASAKTISDYQKQIAELTK